MSKELVEAVSDLIDVLEEDFGSSDDDSDSVDGRSLHTTFGHLRKVRAALSRAQAPPSDDVVERVARAIYETYPGTMTWHEIVHHGGDRYMRCMGEARAAINALNAGGGDE